jgi:hypothetical protein
MMMVMMEVDNTSITHHITSLAKKKIDDNDRIDVSVEH